VQLFQISGRGIIRGIYFYQLKDKEFIETKEDDFNEVKNWFFGSFSLYF
jgi:hypothetical protein